MLHAAPADNLEVCTFRRRLLARSGKVLALIVTSAVLLTGIGAFGAATIIFGPRTYTRGSGKPVAVKHTFRVARPSGPYTLRIVNHGVTSAVIELNGRVVFDPDDFTIGKKGEKDEKADRHERDRDGRDRDKDHHDADDKDRDDRDDDRVPVPLLTRPVTLRPGGNEIIVELRSRPGTSLIVEILSNGATDTAPPTITALAVPPANANGWNNTSVTVTFACADDIAVQTCPAPMTVSAEGAGQVVSGTATDTSGNTASASLTLNIDKTGPIVTATAAPAANAAGWNNGLVVITFFATDALSGIVPGSLTAPVTLVADGTNLSASGQAFDLAGNVGSATYNGVKIDRTPPTITYGLTPVPNASGFVAGPVTVHYTCADGGSGIANCSPDQAIAAVGPHAGVTGTATDVAGNTASVTTTPFTIQSGNPTITSSLSPSPNADGWHKTAVTVHFTCLEDGVPLAGCPADVVVSTEGAGQTLTRTVTDAVGVSASVTTDPFSIDLQGPSVAVALSPAPNASGWNNGPVTAHFNCSDSLSGIATCPADQIVSSDGANRTVVGTAFDRAGNTAQITSAPFSIDSQPPAVSVSLSPSPNGSGWNKTPVTAHFTCSDTGSGIATCPADQVLSGDGANQPATGQATDLAGNVGTATFAGINIDQSNPTITFALSPAPNVNGIVSGPVTIHFTCADSGSGIASCASDQLIAGAGPHAGVTGAATDIAGNTASVTTTPFTIQSGNPTITSSLSPSPNADGWHKTAVTVHFTCLEDGVPLAGCPADVVVSTEGAGQTLTRSVTDPGGVSASVTTDPFSIDLQGPSIAVALSPAPNASGWNNGPVTAHFNCSDSLSGIATCPADQLVSTDGANLTVIGAAVDRAGNTAQITSNPFGIDSQPPAVSVSLSPSPNGSGWNKTPVTAHFTCSDTGSGIATCPADQVVSGDGANQQITGVAIDTAGNSANAAATANVDQSAPILSFASLLGGDTVTTQPLGVHGDVADSTSGLASVTCNGTPATLLGRQFQCDVNLTPGVNSIGASATDFAGNTTSSSLSLNYVRKPKITITSPASLGYFNISPTTVTGTVDDPTATVTINSVTAPVAGGSFTLALPLAEGPNIITATATAPSGSVGTDSVEVTLDTTPPHVTITSPAEGFVTTEASIAIAGNVNDIVVGTVNDQQAQVTVNGAGAQVANRTFLATTVPLAIGLNNIQAVARDRVGNAATTQISVIRRAVTQQQIRLISGNSQTGVIGSLLPAPLVVELSDGLGGTVPNKSVIFKVMQNDGTLNTGGDPAVTVLATTDAQGHAQARWAIGNRAGAGSNVVEAYSVGFEGTAIFNASGTQGTAGKIVIDTGNDQIGAIGQALPKAFIAVVVDAGNNRLGGVPVTFTVQQGGGNFGGQPTYTVNSDSDGRVAATLTLGLQEGSANNLVEANFPFNTGVAAAFTASGRVPGNPTDTTISGVVLDNSNLPIEGVTVRAVLTNVVRSNLSAVQAATAVQTNAQGQFTIPQAPVGLIKLLIDGTTAQREGTYPSLEYDIVTVAGQKNDVGQPIYLLPLSTANQLCVTSTTGGGTLAIPEAPGFSLTFGPGQVTFPGGSKSGCVSVTVVNGDKVPMVPGFGQQPRFIVTIQPSGAVFNPPAPITLPNVDGLAPRAVTEMYSFDHDIGSFVAIGTGIVSEDGQIIRSAPGVGVLKAGWHCGGDPAANGTVADCKVCNSCQGNTCKPDDSNKPPEKCASCNAGSPVPPRTPAQCCTDKVAAGAGGWVVCCNGSQTACVAPSFGGVGKGDVILRACVIAHETEHFKHTECSDPNECGASGPLAPKAGWTNADAECDGSKAEVNCLIAANCAGDTTCQDRVDRRRTQIRNYGNTNKAGCFP